MADDVQVDNGTLTDYVVASDDDGTAQHQQVKLEWGGDGTFTAVETGGGALPIQDGGNSITVDNTVLSVVGGGTEATAQRVTIASDSTGVVSVDDNGGSLTVDGTVTATVTGATITANVVGTGATTIASAVASVTTTSGEAVAARATRIAVTLRALVTNTANIDVGPSGVASGSGFPLEPGASLVLETTAAIHADAASGTQSLAYIEEYG